MTAITGVGGWEGRANRHSLGTAEGLCELEFFGVDVDAENAGSSSELSGLHHRKPDGTEDDFYVYQATVDATGVVNTAPIFGTPTSRTERTSFRLRVEVPKTAEAMTMDLAAFGEQITQAAVTVHGSPSSQGSPAGAGIREHS